MNNKKNRLDVAVETLFKELIIADNYFQHTKKKNDIVKVRISIQATIAAFAKFTRELTTQNSPTVPPALTYLATEFAALNLGRHSPLFQPIRNASAPKQTRAEEALRRLIPTCFATSSGSLERASIRWHPERSRLNLAARHGAWWVLICWGASLVHIRGLKLRG